MSDQIHRKIGQLVIVGFDGTSIPSDLQAISREMGLGGVVLFDRNIESPEQVGEVAYEALALSRELPPWVSIDQEGGRVARLKSPFTRWPAMSSLGRGGDIDLAARFAHAMARELEAVGITLDYAPVLDVNTNPENVVIGDRALAGEPEAVGKLGEAIVDSFQSLGVAACAKHFPGHGDTSEDSHFELPVVSHSVNRLRDVEMHPFRVAIARDVAAVMTAHVLYSSLDEERPATLSHQIVTGILREKLGFEGLIISDDMEMAAISDGYSIEDATVRAVGAGCDMVLLCGSDVDKQVRVLEALIRAVENDRLKRERVEESFARQEHVKARFLRNRREWRPLGTGQLRTLLGCDDHFSIAQEMERFL
jgi:beta-N-acetylhexosaminidase